mmetsp:Transcript_6943/g.14994  ORF Transcript_6943/g.14994 Transcript_6943/m.14994 type:complete len:420 (-) Transcript_6943:78-1337(-)|eukprot:CAMPEP_0170608276 /NCGR_PEP_ID=MMETSP0224-20130122/21501_1 /TAXON_ID=285029 /ORGANISM="Togula jolla, Strain CCCM 725" /LENGTH=419 /DNA_ID=CAMNT_0010933497 /DNA_START=32 /DNA_END=1291 /DNA_ORIENTATION=+
MTQAAEELGTSSTSGAAFNILCTVVGSGLLQLPYAARRGGWCSVPILALTSAMALYTADILIKCLHLAKSRLLCEGGELITGNHAESYGDIGQAAFGSLGRWAVNVQMHFTLVMVATIFNLLAGKNVAAVLGPSYPWLTQDYAIVLVGCVVWLHVFLKTLGEVAVVSAVNFAVTLVLEAVVIVVAIQSPPEEPPNTELVEENVMSLGSAFATCAFAYGVHPILPSVYKSMRSPSSYRAMVLVAFLGAFALYLPMLVVNYAIYGDQVQSPVYAVPSMAKNPAIKVVVAFLTVHIMGGYAIVSNPPELALEGALRIEDRSCPLLRRILLRSCFVLLSVTVSILFQDVFPPFVELVSSCTSTFTQFIFPCLFYRKLARVAGVQISRLESLWIGAVLAVSVLGAIFGTIQALRDISAELAHIF